MYIHILNFKCEAMCFTAAYEAFAAYTSQMETNFFIPFKKIKSEILNIIQKVYCARTRLFWCNAYYKEIMGEIAKSFYWFYLGSVL